MNVLEMSTKSFGFAANDRLSCQMRAKISLLASAKGLKEPAAPAKKVVQDVPVQIPAPTDFLLLEHQILTFDLPPDMGYSRASNNLLSNPK
jgi:hypothetical protein